MIDNFPVYLKYLNTPTSNHTSLKIGSSTFDYLGPVAQSIFGLTSPLVVKMLTVLVSTISNSQVFSLKKM